MNATEKRARKWLSETRGLSEDEIIFYSNKTPDFILPDGSKYEIKLLYKDKVILFPSQLKTLEEQPDITVLVFARSGLSPMTTIPAGELVNAISSKAMCWQNIKLIVFDKGLHKLQIYLPDSVQEVLDRYIVEKYSSEARMVTGIVTRALTEFLEREGYMEHTEHKEHMEREKPDGQGGG